MQNVAVRCLLLIGLALPAFAGCGGSLTPIEVQAGCPEMPLRGPEELASVPQDNVIDDFEDGDLMLKPVGGRVGTWVGVGTMGSTTFGEASTRCVARGTHSGHLTAMETQSYLANWNAVMIDPFIDAHGYNAETYSGFSFWIARGENAMPPYETPIGVTTTDTVAGGTVCTVPGGVCGDYYAIRKRIPLTRTWTRWVIRFADLSQYGFGVPLVPLRRSGIVSIIIWPENQFDIWIDDVRFEP
jgi:hypothetical protein